MKGSFNDHFSDCPADYRTYRPEYPKALFAYLAEVAPSRAKAWDCATGSGQAAGGLRPFFATVVATDASFAQVAHARRGAGLCPLVALAEEAPFAPGEFDLITVAQALHWFKIDDFFREAERVLKPQGVLAVWSYNLLTVKGTIDRAIHHFYHRVVGPYWPAERQLVADGYRGIAFPWQELRSPPLAMGVEWNLHQLLGYLGTWSAVKKMKAIRGIDPLPELAAELAALWRPAEQKWAVRWPLTMHLRRKVEEF